MIEIPFLGPILVVALALLVIYFAVKLTKKLIVLAINSLIGLALLVLLNLLPQFNIAINLWSILIVALGGIPGLILVAILHSLGIVF